MNSRVSHNFHNAFVVDELGGRLHFVVKHPNKIRDQLVRYLSDGNGLRRDKLRD